MRGGVRRAVVVGGGLNSLVAAAVLARRGCTVVLVERRDGLGGRFGDVPLANGSRVALLFDEVAAPHRAMARALDLPQHGLQLDAGRRAVRVAAAGGEHVEVSWDGTGDRLAMSGASAADQEALGRFAHTVGRLAASVGPLLRRAPPVVTGNGSLAVWPALLAAREYVRLRRAEIFAALRWPPMPVADLAAEWFETPLVRALLATRGLYGAFAGPRSAGTTAVLLLRAAAEGAAFGPRACVSGGGSALVRAVAHSGRAAGVDLRTGIAVTQLLVKNGSIAGVATDDGRELACDLVVSGLGHKKTLLDLIEPGLLDPDIVRRVRNIRARGTVARVLFELEPEPHDRSGADGAGLPPQRVHLVDSIDALERAFDASKYGGLAERPWVELAVQPAAGSNAAPGGAIAATVHCVPPAPRDGWAQMRERLAGVVTTLLAERMPALSRRIARASVVTPADLGEQLSLDGGHPLHAELALDQLWVARPALGLGGYRTPIGGLYVCGPGTHPGVGPPGTSGWLAGHEVLHDLRA